MRYIKLGCTDMSVSIISSGCWAFAGDQFWGEQDDAVSINTVHAALEAGVNFFDNAEGYGGGHSEVVLGRTGICGNQSRDLDDSRRGTFTVKWKGRP